MLRVTIFIALFALTSVSGTLRLTQSEIEYQENDMTATIEMIRRFLRDMEATTHDVDHSKDAVYRLLPTLRSLRDIFTFAVSYFDRDSSDITSLTQQFQQLIKQFNRIGIEYSHFADLAAQGNTKVLQWYKEHRAPLDYVEDKATLYAEALNKQERHYYLGALRDECQSKNPHKFFADRVSSVQRAAPISTLVGDADRTKLVQWVKAITADAARAIALTQACLGVAEAQVPQAQANQFVVDEWAKLTEILNSLEKEIERHRDLDVEEGPGFDIRSELTQFSTSDDSVSIAKRLHQSLSAKHNTLFFGVFVFNSEYTKRVFNSERLLEFPFDNTRTIAIFWAKKADHDQKRQQSIKAYSDGLGCDPEFNAINFRTQTLSKVSGALRERGATAVYVTNGNFASVAYPQVSFASRKRCEGKQTEGYSRVIIAGY